MTGRWSVPKNTRTASISSVASSSQNATENKRALRRELWWIYGERAPGLYEAIDGLDHVLAIARTAIRSCQHASLLGTVFNDQYSRFRNQEDFASLAILSSSVHSTWVIRYCAYDAKHDISYAPSDVFLTLPRPEADAGA